MYVEEIVCKRKGKEYRTLLVRESFRVGKTVQHRTIANISQLPQGCVEEIKRYLQGKPGDLDFSQVQVLESKEYGASQCFLSVAKKIELDLLISSQKKQWREDVLALIVGKMLYSGNELSLTKLFADSVLWEACGHPPNTPPDVQKHCYKPLEHLLQKQKSIQKKLLDKHLAKEKIALCYVTSTIVKEGGENFEQSFLTFNENQRLGHLKIYTGLLTNVKGCPMMIEILPKTLIEGIKPIEIKKIADNLDLQCVVFISNREILTLKRIQEIKEQGFKSITTLFQDQIEKLLEKKIISLDHFSSGSFGIFDPENISIRYILGTNIERKMEKTCIRIELIKKTEKLLKKTQKAKGLTEKDIFKALEKTFKMYNTEQFFFIDVKDGCLKFAVNQAKILQEEQFDGCYVIRTDVETERMSNLEIVNAYQQLKPIEESFRIIETTSSEISPSSLQLNDRIRAHVVIGMLSYYLHWHIHKKLGPVYGKKKGQSSTFAEVIEKLKSIRSQTVRIGNITVNQIKSTLDEEQREIISAFGVTIVAKLPIPK